MAMTEAGFKRGATPGQPRTPLLLAVGIVVTLLGSMPARGETPPARPVVTFLGVRGADDSVKTKDVEQYASRLVTALKASKSFLVVTPDEMDGRAGGRVARTALLESLRPGEQLESGPHGTFGDRVLIVTLEDIGAKHRAKADLYGANDGTLYYSIFASRDRVSDLAHALEEKLAPRPTKTVEASDLVKLVRESPVTAAPDWPLTIHVRVEPAARISLAVHVRQDGDSTFEDLPQSAIVEESPGDFTLRLRPTRSGNLSFYIVALRSETEGSDSIACTDGNDETPNKVAIDDRETALVDLSGMAPPTAPPMPAPSPRPKVPVADARSLAKLGGPRVPTEALQPQPGNPAVPITAFTTAGVAAIVGAFFTLQTFTTANDLRSCPTVSLCRSKTSALNLNQTIAWSMYGVTAAGVGVGGLSLAFRW